MELEIDKKYIYTMRLSEERDGEIISWTKAIKIKYLGKVNDVHPELGCTHCAEHMFIGAECLEDETVFPVFHTLADYELPNLEPLMV